MSSTYTAVADAIVSGGAVQIVEPNDGDLASAASNNVPEEKLADIVKKIVDRALLAGLDPSVLDAHRPNGILFTGEGGPSSVGSIKTRMYEGRSGHYRGFCLTSNASWDGANWNRDSAQSAFLFALAEPDNSGYPFRFMHFDATATAAWTDGDWKDEGLSIDGIAQGAGWGIIKPPAVHQVQGGIGFTGTWANYTTGGLQGAFYYKDVTGRVWLGGAAAPGVNGTGAFTLPVEYRPAFNRGLFANIGGGTGATVGVLTTGVVQVTWSGGAPAAVTFDGLSFN